MKMKKKLGSMLLVGVLSLSLCACTATPAGDGPATAPGDSPSPEQTSTAASIPSAAPDSPSETPASLESSGTLGDYSVEIKDFALAQDYSGAPAIIISYTFTNQGEDATSAMVALHGIAFQNGVQLDSAVITGNDGYLAENSMKDIKTGGTIDITEAFLLTSDTAPVEYELSELISFSDEQLGKTFSIADGGTTQPATIDVPADAVTGTVGDFEVSIISCESAKDYEGKDALVVTYGFKNNGSKDAAFASSLSHSAYQDSVQLSPAVVTSTSEGLATAQLRYVKPGAAILVQAAYTPTSTSPVEIEVKPIFSMSKDSVTRTFSPV